MAASFCPGCGEAVTDEARFCEACGHELDAPVTHRLAISAEPPPACASCHERAFSAAPHGGSYCDNCGTRRPTNADRTEVDFDAIAAVSDIGKRHHHNEDAFGLAALPGAAIAVVCDGVSSSTRPDTASRAAVDAAIRTFVRMIEAAPGGTPDAAIAETAMIAAAGSAQAAAVQVADPKGPGSNPPSATFVAAVITADAISVGWIGDSRAYWLPDSLGDAPPTTDGLPIDHARRTEDEPSAAGETTVASETASTGTAGEAGAAITSDAADEGTHTSGAGQDPDLRTPICMTVDDTLGGQLSAAGVEITEASPNMSALIRWLGADATDTAPHVRVFRPTGPGRIVVCSDGLYRYAPVPAALAALTPPGEAIAVARKLIAFALDEGGQDNVTAIVMPYPPPAKL